MGAGYQYRKSDRRRRTSAAVTRSQRRARVIALLTKRPNGKSAQSVTKSSSSDPRSCFRRQITSLHCAGPPGFGPEI
jgi:hypothetical protein